MASNVVENMKNASDVEFNKDKLIKEFCECCAFGKQIKQPHKSEEKD